MRPLFPLLFFLFSLLVAGAQPDFYASQQFSRADSLRGALRPERSSFDVTFYGLHLDVDPAGKSIAGYVDIAYRITAPTRRIQLDLYRNMRIDRVEAAGSRLPFQREADAFFVTFPQVQPVGHTGSLRVYYHGQPTEAQNPPWDGGFIWTEDERGRPWISVACEGAGASLWWPNKDHLSDEPDSVLISVRVPKGLRCIANGNLVEEVADDTHHRFDWAVSYPINNYNVTLNIGHYAHFADKYYARDGSALPLDYYVMDYSLNRAKTHFKQTQQVLAAYEHYLDKYPFWNDGFALVETPYLGMEHQSAIAYGNRYLRGYLGGMIPEGMDWDYIIVHETGHEYFGNSVSVSDLAELWIHESFTTYLESLFVEYIYGYDAAVDYLQLQRAYIYNQEPILGPAQVNWDKWASSDHYFKGAWMLHTLRHAIADDELWFPLLKNFYRDHALQAVSTQDFIRYVNRATNTDWGPFFEQYLQYPQIPVLRYRLQPGPKGLQVSFRWQTDIAGFAMPVLLGKSGQYTSVTPVTHEWRTITLPKVKANDFEVATDFFLIETKEEN